MMHQHVCELDTTRTLSPRIRQLCASLHRWSAFRSHSPGHSLVRCHAGVSASARGQRHSSNDKLCITTPHSGYHFDSTRDQFFEGWYWKITLPGSGQSFAFIYSIEDPQGNSPRRGVGAQIMGPDDSYLLQYTKNTGIFWADQHSLSLGAVFKASDGHSAASMPNRLLPEASFNQMVDLGYQASQSWHQGALIADEGGCPGDLRSSVASAQWAFSVTPLDGWGPRQSQQRATAGWLSALPVFEPHWQVLMARGAASGWVDWGGKRYEFTDAPAYAEKNWGAGFPKKWFWIECAGFDNEPDAAITCVGARRGLLQLPGVEEDVGMVGIHWRGRFIELVPWKGEVQWEVEPWGSWRVLARSAEYEAVVEATCAQEGTPLRAPTAETGLDVFCRDSFFGEVRVRVWQRARDGVRQGAPLFDLTSTAGAVEVGGGPWWSTWKAQADMKEPLKSLVGLPVDVAGLAALLPQQLRPLGL